MSLLSNVFKGVAVATAIGAGIYVYTGMYSHNGSEFKVVMNTGRAKSVTSAGLRFALMPYDRIFSIPQTRQITTIEDADVNLRSESGEEFIGGLRVEYKFKFSDNETTNKTLIENLFQGFNIQNTGEFWDTTKIDPVEKTVNARAKTAAIAAFQTIQTDEYQGKMVDIQNDVKTSLQGIMDTEKLPVEILSIDTSGVRPSDAVQDRINRIASERRENERAQVIVDNSAKVKEAAEKEAEVTLAFTDKLRAAGYSEEAVVILNCQRLADRADRFGIPFGVACQGGVQQGTGVVVDASKYTLQNDVSKAAAVPVAAPQ